MTINRMTGPDSAVMCNLINTHTHTQTHIILYSIFLVILILNTVVVLRYRNNRLVTTVEYYWYLIQYEVD